MISSLVLKNVQRHVNLVLDFHPGVNYITGATCAGKSTIARAFRWVCFNKPSNNSLLRRGTEKTVVGIRKDEHDIQRIRTKSKNLYVLDGKIKRAFGKGVPEEIMKVLDMDETLHFQRQSDQYFMLALSSPVERAKAMERFTDLSVISQSITRARSSVLAFSRSITLADASLSDCRKSLEQLSPVLSLKGSIMLLSEMRDKIKEYAGLRGLLIEKHSILQSIKTEEASLARRLTVRPEKAAQAVRSYDRVCTRLALLQGYTKRIGELSEVRTLPDAEAISTISIEIEKYERISSRLRVLVRLKERLEEAETEHRAIQKDLSNVEKEISKLKVCPTCQQPLKKGSSVLRHSGCAQD